MSGNIPQSFIDELLTRVDIVDIIDGRVTLKKAGKDYQACCPFHSEKTPSFTVSQQKQFFYCFGCGATGSALGFLMDFDNMGFVEAVEELAKTAAMVVPYQHGKAASTGSTQSSSVNYYELLAKVANYYESQLRHHTDKQQAIDYLKQRGLTGEIAKEFELGYAPPGWANLMSAFGKEKNAQGHLIEMGLLVQKDNGQVYDRFRDRIMFPIRDRRGRAIAFGGRVINPENTPKYLNSPETPVFHKGKELYGLHKVLKSLPAKQQVIVVEGYMDVVSLAHAGVDNAVATLGTAVSESHVHTLVKHFDEVIYCFDGDAAGKKAGLRAMETSLSQVNKSVAFRFMFLPQGEDPDSVVKSGGAERFHQMVRESLSLSDFLISELLSKADYRALDGQARLLEMARPYIEKIPNGGYLQLISSELSKYVNMDGEHVMGQLAAKTGATRKSNRPSRQSTADEKPSMVRLAIAMLLEEPSLANKVEQPQRLLELNLAGVKFLVELLVFIQESPNINTGAILEHWRDTPQVRHLHKILRWEHHVPEQGFETEFIGTINLLQRQILEQALNELLQRSKQGKLTSMEKQQMNELIGLCQGKEL